MVGTFISKYLLVTTSTITVTSAAAVTFFVAKHLKVGKGYEMAMDYIKGRYNILLNNEMQIRNIKNFLETELIEKIKKLEKDNKEAPQKCIYCQEISQISLKINNYLKNIQTSNLNENQIAKQQELLWLQDILKISNMDYENFSVFEN